MKIQRWIISAITVLFLLFFADAILAEMSWFHSNSASSPTVLLMTASSSAEKNLNDNFHLRYFFYEVAGLFNRCTGRRHVDNCYKLDNGHLVTVGGNGEISESVAGMETFRNFCAEKKLPLLYVNIPKHYCQNEDLTTFGVADLTGLKSDRFLNELNAAGIDTLNIRPFIEARYENPCDAFFKTDQHWKISTGLYCAQILSVFLRDEYGIDLMVENIRDDAFSVSLLKNSWLGERGKKTGSAYSGLDDFEVIIPLRENHFHLEIPDRQISKSGDFSIMTDQSKLQTDFWRCRYGSSFYYFYLFGNDPIQIITNEDLQSGRILLIKDSFSQALAPFLAMTANTLVTWDIRYNTDSLRDYIAQNKFDAVIVIYSESMINNTHQKRFLFDFS